VFRAWWIVFALALPAAASAGDVFDCVTGRAKPPSVRCPDGQVERLLPPLPGYADPPTRDPATAPTTFAGVAIDPGGDRPTAGMDQGDDGPAVPAAATARRRAGQT
jgi:hypothetical protein